MVKIWKNFKLIQTQTTYAECTNMTYMSQELWQVSERSLLYRNKVIQYLPTIHMYLTYFRFLHAMNIVTMQYRYSL